MQSLLLLLHKNAASGKKSLLPRQGTKRSLVRREVLAQNDKTQDTKKELIIILLPNNNTVLMTDPACINTSRRYTH